MSLIIVRHGKRTPIVLFSNRLMRGKRQGECLIHSYLDRLACEEGCRFSKQGFDFERVQTRSYAVLRNHVALAMVSWAMLTEEQHQAES